MASRRKQPDPRNVAKGSALEHNASVEHRYTSALETLVKRMTAEVNRELAALFKTDAAAAHFEIGMDANIASQARIVMSYLAKKFTDMFNKQSKQLAEQMINGVNRESGVNVTRSLKEIAPTIRIDSRKISEPVKTVMKASIAENVDLIKSIPQQYLSGVQQAVMRSITTGNGMADLKPFLEKQGGITERRARNIANDQTRKAYNSLNRARMEQAGITKFEWVHSAGGKDPRPLHMNNYPAGLNGGIFSFDDLPVIDERTGERGIPGQAPMCRCRMRPLIDFGDNDDAT